MNPPGRREFISAGDKPFDLELSEGAKVRMFVSGALGAVGMSTGMAVIHPGFGLPYHTHPTSEVITGLRGIATVEVEGRQYRLEPFDSIHIPAETAHAVQNDDAEVVQLHVSFPTGEPTREFIEPNFVVRRCEATSSDVPETLRRFRDAEPYALADQTAFRDLFSRRLGSRGVCGGHGLFQPGASLPCHTHEYDESITIVQGTAVCLVAGQRYTLTGNATACIPRGRPHRFLNESTEPMAMVWVYAGEEPDRVIVDDRLCRILDETSTW